MIKEIKTNYSFIMTYNNIKFSFYHPTSNMINILDIAHALAHICRFTGHVPEHYSVAQHSILLSQCVSKDNCLWALLHDAPECYINDMASPVKQFLGQDYIKLEDNIIKKICYKFKLNPTTIPKEVKILDRILTLNEFWILYDPSHKIVPQSINIPTLITKIDFWPAYIAKQKFLDRFIKIQNGGSIK